MFFTKKMLGNDSIPVGEHFMLILKLIGKL